MEGWIKIYRQLADNSLWIKEPFTRGQAWVDLLILTNHKDGYIRTKNGERIDVKRGQIGWSQLALSKRWKWSRGKVKRFFEELEKNDRQIVQQKVKDLALTTVLNYELYQQNGQQMIQQTDSKQDTNKNDKNEKKRESTPLFKSITYLKAIPLEDLPDLMKGLKVTTQQVQSKAEDLVNYCEGHGKTYKNYRALLRNALKKDFPSLDDGYRLYQLPQEPS